MPVRAKIAITMTCHIIKMLYIYISRYLNTLRLETLHKPSKVNEKYTIHVARIL
jgi:hypothetical protein